MEIYQNTAKIRDMFNSALEVTKFEGAILRTVSGIRGKIKKPTKEPEGSFRATFEDKILMSDIVFLKAWHPVQPHKYYNPVFSALIPNDKKWHGMKLTGTLRYEKGLKVPQKEDSKYRV